MPAATDPAPTAPSWLVEIPLAHRGLHAEGVPENSLAAFQAAADAGYGVELDVMLSRDGVPVIAHDPDLSRVAGRAERVGDLTLAELAEVRLEGTDEHVPTLAAALRVFPDLPVMVEVKNGSVRRRATESATAAVLDLHRGPVCVAGFNPATLRWFRRHRPHVPRVMTSGGLTDVPMAAVVRRRLEALRDLDAVDPIAVSYALEDLPHPATDAWRARGGALVTWTVTCEADLVKAREVADNHIFENIRP